MHKAEHRRLTSVYFSAAILLRANPLFPEVKLARQNCCSTLPFRKHLHTHRRHLNRRLPLITQSSLTVIHSEKISDNAARVLKKIIELREAAGQGLSNIETAKLSLALADVYVAGHRQTELEESVSRLINAGKGTPLATTIIYAQALEKLAGSLQSGSPKEQELLREALKIRESIPWRRGFCSCHFAGETQRSV